MEKLVDKKHRVTNEAAALLAFIDQINGFGYPWRVTCDPAGITFELYAEGSIIRSEPAPTFRQAVTNMSQKLIAEGMKGAGQA